MQRNWFQIKDFLSAKLIKHFSGFFSLAIFSLSIMSFNNDGNSSKKGSKSSKDSLNQKGFKNLLNADNASSHIITGELNPRAVSFVTDFIKRQSNELNKMKTWGKPYFNLFDRILTDNGVPTELKYLSVIESDLRGGLISSAGAVGPWQLMPDEGKRFNLKMGNGIDDRKNFSKSTEVAARLLKELYDEFGNWLLVVAAYNCGAGRVREAIKKAGSDNFWNLQYFLPEETRNHVKKFIATNYFFEGTAGLTTMTADEIAIYNTNLNTQNNAVTLDNKITDSTSLIDISGKYNSDVIAQNLSMDFITFNNLNPGFDKTIRQGETYHMRLPNHDIFLFLQKKQQILQQSVQLLLGNSNVALARFAK